MHQPVETNYKNGRKLKYAIVELIADKGRAQNIEGGLLRGIGKDAGDNFLWLVTSKKVSRACSLAYYNILSVVTFDGFTKTYTFFMADEDEQAEARKVTEEAYDGLKELALPENAVLLDVSKFEEVPENFGRLSTVHSSAAASSIGHQTGAASTNMNDWYGKQHNTDTQSYVHNDPEPFSWKRKTRKPTKKALEALRNKLDLIAKREYEVAMRAIKGEKDVDDEECEKESAQNQNEMFQSYDDEHFPFGP